MVVGGWLVGGETDVGKAMLRELEVGEPNILCQYRSAQA